MAFYPHLNLGTGAPANRYTVWPMLSLTAPLGPGPGRLAGGGAGLHLAVMIGPFLHLMLTGAKSVESRCSGVRCAP